MASGDGDQRRLTVTLLDCDPAEDAAGAQCTTDGSLDADGNPAARHRTGGWRACRSILAMEFFYGVAYYGVMDNLVTYLTTVMRESNAAAARNVSTWQATCFLTPLAGALLADSCWGRYRAMLAACSVAVAGLLMVFLSAMMPLLDKSSADEAAALMGSSTPEVVLFFGLYMAALGLGGLRPCIMSFGADQFDDGDPSERAGKGSFFNWYVFTMSCSSIAASTAVVWVQDHYGWALGLAIPGVLLAAGLLCLVAGARSYRFQLPSGSPFTGVCQVVVAAVRKFHVAPPADTSLLYDIPEDDDCAAMKGVQRIAHTTGLRFLDKAAVVAASDMEAVEPGRFNPWRLCTVTQVEEVKSLARLLPVWATILFFYSASAQAWSTFVEQGMAMDVVVGSVRVPPASMNTFLELAIVVLVPIYDRAFVPAARRVTGREKGIPALLRIGVGHAISVLAMAAAALVEAARLRAAAGHGPATSILWQVPQYAAVGAGEVFTTVGQFEFFYSQAPVAMRTVCPALGMLAIAAGDYLSSLVLAAVQWATTAGGRPGWIPDDVDEGHLDRFFWMMAALGCVNLVAFAACAMRYNSRKPA